MGCVGRRAIILCVTRADSLAWSDRSVTGGGRLGEYLAEDPTLGEIEDWLRPFASNVVGIVLEGHLDDVPKSSLLIHEGELSRRGVDGGLPVRFRQ